MNTAIKKSSSAEGPGSSNGEHFTLEFENARSLQAIYGGDESLLRKMEELFGIRLTSREGWIHIQGPAVGVARAKKIFGQLCRVSSSGGVIGRDEFLFALDQEQIDGSSEETGCLIPSGQSPLELLYSARIQCSPRKPAVIPKTNSQREYLLSIDTHDITFGIGPAGTGKTYLAVAKAVEALKLGKVNRIILTRPAVEAGEALGFLPGDLEEKILPYLRPLYDSLNEMMESDEIQTAIDRNIIEIAPLAYMRGRTLNKAFIILDEAQNTTTEQMFMFLTRVGVGSKSVITGDRTQVDLPKNKPNGLIEAVGALKETPGISFHLFSDRDVVRHPLVQAIIASYQEHRGLRESRF